MGVSTGIRGTLINVEIESWTVMLHLGIVVGEPRHLPGAPLWLVLASYARDPLV